MIHFIPSSFFVLDNYGLPATIVLDMLNQLSNIQRVQVSIGTFGEDLAYKYQSQNVKNAMLTLEYMENYTSEYYCCEYITRYHIQEVQRFF